MDRLVEIVVRLVAGLAGQAHRIPGVRYASHRLGEPLRVLLVGYNGARNTGSDVRVAALAQQLEQLMGEKVRISVSTLNPASIAPYFGQGVQLLKFSPLFFGDLLKACSENHVAILCEGSTFKSKFADALTLYSLEAAGVMRAQGKPCIAYGSEVGEMEPYLERAMRDLCTDVRFAVRSAGSHEALKALGFSGYAGTDTAWSFDSSSGRQEALELMRAGGWDGKRPLLGIAAINPFCWPVRPSLPKLVRAATTGDRTWQFQSLYFFSWDEDRARRLEAYLDALAGACAAFAAEQGFQPVIFGMEELDADACAMLAKRMGPGIPVLLSREHDGYVMAAALRFLDMLVTSRYHAQVLASEALVPTVAVTMDERLANLAEELGMDPELLLSVEDADLGPRILLALDHALEHEAAIRAQLADALRLQKAKLADMGEWLVAQLG